MKKIVLWSGLIGIIIIFLLSFFEIEKAYESPSRDSILYGINSLPKDLKDVSKLTTREEDIICATSKGLVEKNKAGKIVPSLATEIKVKDDGIEYEFKIREDAYWNNGQQIKAEDIRVFFKELLKEEDEKNILPFLNVYGAKEFREGKVTFETGVAIETNDNILKIRLNKKDDKFLEELTKPQYRVRKYLMMWSNIEKNHKNILYSGEYYINEVNKEEFILKKNPNNKGESIGTITIIEDANEELAMAAFELGERDIVINPPNNQLNRLEEEGKLKTFNSDKGKYIALNVEKENLPLSKRKALYYNINRAMINYQENNSNYIELAEGSYFREDKDNLDKLQGRKVMTNQSEEKLNDVVTILAKDNNENRLICKHIQTWFEENKISNLRYTLVSEEDYNNLELRKRYDGVIIDGVIDSNYRKEFYSSLKSHYSDKEFKLYNTSVKNDDKNFNVLEDELFNNYSILPIFFEKKNVVISKEINNLEFDWHGNIKFSTLK